MSRGAPKHLSSTDLVLQRRLWNGSPATKTTRTPNPPPVTLAASAQEHQRCLKSATALVQVACEGLLGAFHPANYPPNDVTSRLSDHGVTPQTLYISTNWPYGPTPLFHYQFSIFSIEDDSVFYRTTTLPNRTVDDRALKPVSIYCYGSFIMHLVTLTIMNNYKLKNFKYILVDN